MSAEAALAWILSEMAEAPGAPGAAGASAEAPGPPPQAAAAPVDGTQLLAGVDLDAWGPLIDRGKLSAALEAVAPDWWRLSPAPAQIFEFMRYATPDELSAVIIGQDPYASAHDAQGLAFSVAPGRPIPPSLKAVFACLAQQGLRAAPAEGSGDLRQWAAQGVLLLNAALTTRQGARRAHADAWAPFVRELVARLCRARAGRPLHFLLWGSDARAFAPLIGLGGAGEAPPQQHVALEWTHPSPLADNRLPLAMRFAMCPHFGEVNAALVAAGRRPVRWDTAAPVLAFTDGGCTANGKPGARAAFAAYLTGGPFSSTVLRGRVQAAEYAFISEEEPHRGVAPVAGTHAPPSNNRGELLGLIYALLALLRACVLGPVEVVSDSDISLRTLDEWLPARRANGTAAQLKNFDLVQLAERLLGLVRAQAAGAVLTHVRSHQPEPPAGAPGRARLLWKGNAAADRHAGEVLAQPGGGEPLEVLAAPPAVGALRRELRRRGPAR